jgi:hypothetical protein
MNLKISWRFRDLWRASVACRCRLRHISGRRANVKIFHMRYAQRLLILLALFFVGWHFMSTRPLEWRPGTLVPDDPKQVNLESARAFAFKDVSLTPRAEFEAEVRVLSRERYWLGTFANVAPLDIAAGWGPMSDSAVLAHLDISQSGRFYFWRYQETPPIPPDAIISHSANWHLIPANRSVWYTLRNLRVGSIVRLQGELVDITRSDGATVKTSLTREDSGAGACEVIYVRSATVRYH